MKDFGTLAKLVIVLFALTTMLGCGALDAAKPVAQSNNGLVAASAVVDFGTVPVGTTQVRTNTIVNTTKSPIVLTRAQIDRTDFAITGQQLPLTLAPGQRVVLQIAYSPQSNGNSESKIVLASNTLRLFSTFTLRGTAVLKDRLVVSPSSVSFGNVPMGKTQTQSATVSNLGRTPITITRAAISGNGFTLTGLSLPLTLQSGGSAKMDVAFAPVSGGSTSAVISVVGTVSIAVPRPPRGFGRQGTVTTVARNTISTTITVPVSGIGMNAGKLAVFPATLAMGSVRIGASQTQSATFINSGSSTLTIRQATVSGRGFKMSGISFPVTLGAGQRKNFAVTFAPQSTGQASGSIAVATDGSDPVVNVAVSGVATPPGALVSTPSSLSFGSVQGNGVQKLSAALTNSGVSNVTVSQASVSSADFRVTDLNLPVTLAPGQSVAYGVAFNPHTGGPASGAVSFGSDATNGSLSVPLTANVLTAGSLTSAPSTLNFGNVSAATPQTRSETLTNSGGSDVTISQANLSGAGFTMTGLTLPMTLSSGQSTNFNVTFTPQSAGAASGNLSVASNASNSTLNLPLVANAATVGVLSTSDSSLDFGSVQINATGTQSETLTNTGGANLTISQANLTGTGFSATGLNLPLTLAPGQSFTFGASFSPTSGGNATGSIKVISDASDSTVTITLAGIAAVAGQLVVSPATLSFGSVTVGQSKSLTASLTASGSSITVSNASMSTSEFSISGLSLPLTLAAGKSATFTVTFKPQSSGTASASGSFNSNASNSSAAQALGGTGTAAPQHSVALSWDPSSSNVVGYNIYRGGNSGGPYSKVSSMNLDTTYVDSSVQSGQTYFYVTTAVDGSGKESTNSNQIQATIPTP